MTLYSNFEFTLMVLSQNRFKVAIFVRNRMIDFKILKSVYYGLGLSTGDIGTVKCTGEPVKSFSVHDFSLKASKL